MKNILAFTAVLLFVASTSAQSGYVKIQVLYDKTDTNSSAVGPLLMQKFAASPKVFTLVKDEEKNISVIVECYRDTSNDPYSCFYVANKVHASTQSFLGGAIVVKKTAEETATALFVSVLQDIVERWNSTERRMLIGELETCLALTESGCAVPEPLVSELKAKSINLSQYLRRGGLKP